MEYTKQLCLFQKFISSSEPSFKLTLTPILWKINALYRLPFLMNISHFPYFPAFMSHLIMIFWNYMQTIPRKPKEKSTERKVCCCMSVRAGTFFFLFLILVSLKLARLLIVVQRWIFISYEYFPIYLFTYVLSLVKYSKYVGYCSTIRITQKPNQ